jgi:putative copper resistance protein D
MYTLLVVIHVMAALIWVGGVVFIGLALLPATRGLEPEKRLQMVSGAARRFRNIGWLALAVLIVTGLGMIHSWGFFAEAGSGGLRNRLLLLKISLVVVMLICSALHDWFLGPRVSAAVSRGDDPGPIRSWSMRLGQGTMVLSLLIVILAVLIARPALLHQLWGGS